MIRAVLDTNLPISYLLSQGATLSRIFDHWEQGNFIYLVSPAIVQELKDVIERPRLRQHMAADPQVLVELIENDAEHTSGRLALTGICRDPKDDIFIACAVEGDAHYIVSGDADLLDLSTYQDIQIIRPKTFVELLDAL